MNETAWKVLTPHNASTARAGCEYVLEESFHRDTSAVIVVSVPTTRPQGLSPLRLLHALHSASRGVLLLRALSSKSLANCKQMKDYCCVRAHAPRVEWPAITPSKLAEDRSAPRASVEDPRVQAACLFPCIVRAGRQGLARRALCTMPCQIPRAGSKRQPQAQPLSKAARCRIPFPEVKP